MGVTEGAKRQQIKQKVIAACRILNRENVLDFFGHVSARLSDQRFLITPRMPDFASLREEDVLTINLDGETTEDTGLTPIEFPLHTAIYERRRDVGSVIHAHPRYATALSATRKRLKVVHQLCLPFIQGVPIFGDYSMIDSSKKAQLMLQALGNGRALMLRNHGVVTTGSGVEEACVLTIWLEKCAEMQLIAGNSELHSIRKNKESLSLLDHQLRTTIRAAWTYYESKHRVAVS